jgi:hypothetical protein
MQMRLDFGLAGPAPGFDNHDRQRPLGPPRIRYLNDGGLDNLRVLQKQIFQSDETYSPPVLITSLRRSVILT